MRVFSRLSLPLHTKLISGLKIKETDFHCTFFLLPAAIFMKIDFRGAFCKVPIAKGLRPGLEGYAKRIAAGNGAGRDPRNPGKPFHDNFFLCKKNGSPYFELPSILEFKKIQ